MEIIPGDQDPSNMEQMPGSHDPTKDTPPSREALLLRAGQAVTESFRNGKSGQNLEKYFEAKNPDLLEKMKDSSQLSEVDYIGVGEIFNNYHWEEGNKKEIPSYH